MVREKGSLVVVGHAKMSSVLGAVGVGVSDKRSFPVVVEECVGDSDVVSSVSEL